MLRIIPVLLFSLFFLKGYGQREARLPADLRQHNLTTYNASLFNPAFSLDRNNPESVALWVRWQWQGIDANPTTMFLNYTRKLDDKSAAGAAFFQHNTGVFFNTGGALNYAYQFEFSKTVKLAVGMNVFAFKQTLADDRFQTDPNLPLPLPTVADDFIVQMAPGASLSVERLTLSLSSENLIDYNFTAKESNTEKEDKIFMSLLSYDFPITLGSESNTFVRPSMYLRTIPGQSNQVGFYTLLNTNRYWGQVGYNNFYGYGIGVGGTFLEHISVGALVEFGSGASINTESSFELMIAYFLGKPEERHKVVGYDIEEEENPLLALEEQQNLEKKTEAEKETKIEVELDKTEEVAIDEKVDEKAVEKLAKEEEKQQRKREKFAKDSITKIEKEAALAARELEKKLEREVKEQAKEEATLVKAEEELDKTEEVAKEEKVDEAAEVEEKIDEKAAEKLAKDEEREQRKREKFVQDSIAKIEKEVALAARELEKKLEKEAKEQAKEEEAVAEAQDKAEKLKNEIDKKSEEAEAVAEAQKRQEQVTKTDPVTKAELAKVEEVSRKRKQDSLIAAAQEARRKANLEAKEDKIVAQNEADKPEADEKYEEVKTEAGLLPGYYLIANVFRTKKYFDAFMLDMKKKGLKPRAFIRGKNKFNYVYLNRYRTMEEARQERDSNLGGKYLDKTWIFRVVGE